MSSRLLTTLFLVLNLSLLATQSVRALDFGFFDPTPAVQNGETYPDAALFDGPYIGVDFNLQANNFMTYYDNLYRHRLASGVVGGINMPLNNKVILGVEGRIEGAYDPWSPGNLGGYNIYALSHLGFLTAKDFMVFNTLAVGLIDGQPAWGYGVGVEQAVNDNFHVRLESTSYGQVAGLSGGTFYGGFTAVEFGLSFLWYLKPDEARQGNHVSWFQGEPSDFTGRFAGLSYGGLVNPDYSILVPTDLKGAHMSHFAGDVMYGQNWKVADHFRVGVEAQGGLHFDTSGTISFQGQGLAKAGFVPMEGLMLYASGGAGIVYGSPVYSVGGGVEVALWGENTARIDVHGIGKLSGAGIEPISTTKFTVGALWYMD